MESLEDFQLRIRGFQFDSVPYEDEFGLPPSLNEKVCAQTGQLRPFFGSTVAYFLSNFPEGGKETVAQVSNSLYRDFAHALAEPLPLELAHVTLHDLYASPVLESIWHQLEASVSRVNYLVERARAIGPMRLQCTAVFNLMNTSIVIGLAAADADEHAKLLAARELFDELVPGAAFTPHITLAYYRPGASSWLDPQALRARLAELTQQVVGVPVVLQPQELFGLHFDSMKNYWPISARAQESGAGSSGDLLGSI